ncbi:MAG: hypothetical protein IJ257_04520 [Treponema sp.]|nr:hypothetical protein [Treponema sp.]
MKALLVADDEKAINNISEVLKSAGYDTIVYKWLLKALDNMEEIAPHLIVISTADYPRHWKTLAQYASSGFGDYIPQVILYTDENFNEEEEKKAEVLHVRGKFDSIGVDGLDKLREILTKADDIFSGHLTEEEISSEPLKSNSGDSEKNDGNNDSFDNLVSKFEEMSENSEENSADEPTLEDIEKAQIEAEGDEEAANRLEEITANEKAADRLEEMSGDEIAADKLERMAGNDEILTVSDVINEAYDDSESTSLPGEEELRKLLAENDFADENYASENRINSEGAEETVKEENLTNPTEEVFEESESNDIIEEDISEEKAETLPKKEETEEPVDSQNGDALMADEKSIEEKLAAIMNANKADQKEKAEALKLDTNSSSVSFVFTNPITLAMVSGVARNYNGLVLEFTPDIPAFILNLSPGTKISIASMKINGKIENVFAEVMSNDAKKLALAIKK